MKLKMLVRLKNRHSRSFPANRFFQIFVCGGMDRKEQAGRLTV